MFTRSQAPMKPTTGHASEVREPVYVQIAAGGLERSTSGNHHTDGRTLVEKCLHGIDRNLFPPQLFVLWATKPFAPHTELLKGVTEGLAEQGLSEIPLIGTSAAAVWFDQQDYAEGVVLICVASRWIKARTSIATEVRANYTRATHQFFEGLWPDHERKVNPSINPNGNRYLMMYVPGHSQDLDPRKYCTHEIVEEINRHTYGRLHVFGGVSSAGMEAGEGYQFCGSKVMQNSIVGAIVTSDVSYGTGLNQGFSPIHQSITVTDVNSDTSLVTAIKSTDGQRPAQEWLRELQERHVKIVCTLPNRRGNSQTFVPSIAADGIRFHRTVPKDVPLQVMELCPKALRNTVLQLRNSVIEQFDIDRSKVAGIIAIGCVSRFRVRNKLEFNIRKMLRTTKRKFPDAIHVGCYLDGELGVDQLGQSVATNMSISELFLTDAIPVTNQNRLVSEAIAKFGPVAAAATTVHDAIHKSLDCLAEAGFPGGVIPLVFKDKQRSWIKGQAAIGSRWINKILPETCRPFEGDDIVAIAAREPNEVHIVLDAQTDPRCDNKTARKGDVRSIAATALLDERSEVLGILIVDLGDLRRKKPGENLKVGLRMLGACIGRWISGATQSEELHVARELDRLADLALHETSVEKAASTFFCGALSVLGIDGHMRLWSPKSKKLSLISGVGPYFETAWTERLHVKLDDPSATVEAFLGRRDRIINDSDADNSVQAIRQQYPSNTVIGRLLESHKSFANCVIDNSNADFSPVPNISEDGLPRGVLTFVSSQKWLFTTALIRSIKSIAGRLAKIIEHVTAVAENAEKFVKLKFRNETSPPAWDERPPLIALQGYMEQLCKANNAEVLSCYLWSDAQDRYVLRAQCGWSDPRWLHAAWFQRGEGMSGQLIEREEPSFIPDRFDPPLNNIRCKYITHMFADHQYNDTTRTYELLVFPLRFQWKKLGVVTMYRRRSKDFQETTEFTTIDSGLLREASLTVSAYIYALTKADEDQWHQAERARQDRVRKASEDFLSAGKTLSLTDLTSKLCDAIAASYRASDCAIFLKNEGEENLTLTGQSKQTAMNVWHMEDVLDSDCQADPIVRRYHASQSSQDIRTVRRQNQVQFIYLPLIENGEKRIGVLGLRWKGVEVPILDQPIPHHNERQLVALAKTVSDAVTNHVSLDKETHANEALWGMAGYLAIAMHEMCNKVQTIQSAIALLSTREIEDPEEEQICWNRVRDATQELQQVFDDAQRRGSLLTVGLRKEWCSIPTLLERAIEQYKRRKQLHCRIENQIPPTARILEFYVNTEQMIECFRNLIANAIREATDSGSIVIRVDVREDFGIGEIRFEDTGLGIPRTTFDEFTRGRFRALRPKGSGLGLFLSRLFCDANRGRLKLDSESNPTIVSVVLSGGRISCQ